jgi:hypothetical protein
VVGERRKRKRGSDSDEGDGGEMIERCSSREDDDED